MTSQTFDAAALMEVFESLTLRDFDRPEADDLERFLPLLFGAKTSVAPFFHCTHLGAWVGGWTVLTSHPGEQGWWAFEVREYEGHGPEWGRADRGQRINRLARAVRYPVCVGANPVEVVLSAVAALDECDREAFDFDTYGALNEAPLVWLVRQALGLLTHAEVELVTFLMGLRHDAETVEWVGSLVARAGHVETNWKRVQESETVVVEAAKRLKGVTLNGAQIEHLGVSGALMTYPRADWDVEASRLVEAAYARGDLGADFYPPAPKPTAGPSGGSCCGALAV